MAVSFYYVDATYVSTDRRSSAVEAMKARRVPRQHSDRAAKPVATSMVLRAVFTGCVMLGLGAFAAFFVPF